MKKTLRILRAGIASLIVFLSASQLFAQTPVLPKNVSAAFHHKTAGDAFLQKGKNLEAISEYQEAVKLNPYSDAVYFNLAIAYFSEKKNENAMASLEKVLELNPMDIEARYNLACLKLYSKQAAEAKIEFEKALADCDARSPFYSMIQKGLKFIRDLNGSSPSSQEVVLYLLGQSTPTISL